MGRGGGAAVHEPLLDAAPGPPCVLEQSFEWWGVMVLLLAAGGGAARLLRKSVGELAGIAQPRYNLTGTDP